MALVITGLSALTGCGGNADSNSTPSASQGNKPSASVSKTAPVGEHNKADVIFASQLILHHQQAVQMAGMSEYFAKTAAVKRLGTSLKGVNAVEVRQMSALLVAWGEPIPSPSHSDHSVSDAVPGMMTEEELSDLGDADGELFDRMWTQMMIRHHRGAVAMAKIQQAAGKNPAMVGLAKKILTRQNAEIATMQRWLGQLPVN
ncbi:DUF305 domain-containing protein [Kribbella sp. DT2]|uniref:DUF305 domain-containing protein n=1 Tax=Kribbella sp. DT2 TaxID=3393427 RepID=UPI003CEFDBA4